MHSTSEFFFSDNISEKQTPSSSKIGSYSFGNVFFYLYWKNDTSVIDRYWPEFDPSVNNQTALERNASKENDNIRPAPPYLLTQMKIKRISKPHAYGRRSKYVVKPEGVVMAGNHIVHKFADGEYILQILK